MLLLAKRAILARCNVARSLGHKGASLTARLTKAFVAEVEWRVFRTIRSDRAVSSERVKPRAAEQGNVTEKAVALPHARHDKKGRAARGPLGPAVRYEQPWLVPQT